MAHNDTVFAQVLKLVPRHEFESLARKHKSGRMSRSMTRWSQFVAMGMAQLTGRCSLRDIVSNLAAQSCKLYHLGRQLYRQFGAHPDQADKKTCENFRAKALRELTKLKNAWPELDYCTPRGHLELRPTPPRISPAISTGQV